MLQLSNARKHVNTDLRDSISETLGFWHSGTLKNWVGTTATLDHSQDSST